MVGTGGPVDTFSVWDYVVFAGTILGAAGVGLFQAIRGRKESSSEEFLLGGRQMTAVPVAMSLTASFMSGITVIGTPAEAYSFGAAFWLFGFAYAIMSVITAELFVPLFYRLGITSAYEYLEMRFSRPLRIIGTSMYIVQTALYTGLVIYAPALALNQITGLDLWGVLVATGAVCILYCTLDFVVDLMTDRNPELWFGFYKHRGRWTWVNDVVLSGFRSWRIGTKPDEAADGSAAFMTRDGNWTYNQEGFKGYMCEIKFC